MKKIYSLFFLAATSLSFAQTTEIFNNSGQSTGAFSGWTLQNNVTTNPIQQSGNSGYLLLEAGNPSDVIITSSYNIANYSNLKLEYEVATYGSNANNSASVSFSYDNGVTYTTPLASIVPTNTTYVLNSNISLNPTSGTVKIKFINSGATGKGVRLKNIILTGEEMPEVALPILSTSVTAVDNFQYIQNNGPSQALSFQIYGSNLNDSNVVVTAPANYEVSLDNQNFSSSATLASFTGDETTIYVRLILGLTAAEYNGNITIVGGGVLVPLSVSLTGEVFEENLIPELNVDSNEITGLTYVEQNGPSLPLFFNVSATNLNASDVVVTAPTNFLVSTDGNNYNQFITLQAFDGLSQVIYVQLASGLLAGEYDGTITIQAGNVPEALTVSVSGIVTPVIVTPVLTVNKTQIDNLVYVEGQGPSASDSFNIEGNQLTGADVIIVPNDDFEVSLDNNVFLNEIVLTTYDGITTPIYVRLKLGLNINTYNGTVSVSGGGVTAPLVVSVSGEVTDPTASVKDNNIEGLKIYPNPASNLVNIVSNEIGYKEVKIFNVLGKCVLDITTDQAVNISNLTPGVYILNIKQDGKKASSKLIVK